MTIITKKDVAKLLIVSERTVDNYMKTQGLPYSKVGRNVRFFLEMVVEWMKGLEKTHHLNDNDGSETRKGETRSSKKKQ